MHRCGALSRASAPLSRANADWPGSAEKRTTQWVVLFLWYANTMDQLSNLKHKIVTSEAVTILRGGAAERVRDDFLMRSIKKSSRTSKVRDDVVDDGGLEPSTSCV